MNCKIITERTVEAFRIELTQEEKSPVTIEKYLRDIRALAAYLSGAEISKDRLIAYKRHLTKRGYTVGSINSMIISVNRYLKYFGLGDCSIRCLRQQEDTFCPEERELTKAEYLRLLDAAKKNRQLYLLLQTIGGTGIRVSELKFFTVEAVRSDAVQVRCKNKSRRVILPDGLARELLTYAKERGITGGPIFCTRSGKPLDRSNIWKMMKALCERAQVLPSKVFPHNLRKLFAKCFYAVEHDIVKLADVLGHRSINTTRIYLKTSGAEHRRQLGKLGLFVDKRKTTLCV